MLKDHLLLDSASSFSNARNNDLGCPERSSLGVLSSCRECSWFALRATYSRELKVRDSLIQRGVKAFVPMIWRKIEAGGKVEKKLVPAVSSLCFVYWTKPEIDAYIRSFGDARPVNYYWDRTAGRPLTIPDKAMEDFIAVASTMDPDLIYLNEVSDKLREGQTVEVTQGPFKGITGKIVRIKKNRRILVELPGMLAVASTYVCVGNVEIV